MACAVLAVQGAFIEHEQRLLELGEDCIELRQAADLARPFDRLLLPGGESTVQGKLLEELGMLEGLRARIEDGMPTLATCAGTHPTCARPCRSRRSRATPRLGTMNITVERNAYGRQLGKLPCSGRMRRHARRSHDIYSSPLYRQGGAQR